MPLRPHKQTGLRLGLGMLAVVSLGFLVLFMAGPSADESLSNGDRTVAETGLTSVLPDAETRQVVEALKTAAPATYAKLDADARRAIGGGADQEAISRMLLEALFAQFNDQAFYLQSATSDDYQSIMAGLAAGLRQMQETDSAWCEGPKIAAFLAQNDETLVPSLLSEFPYGSPQYDWAMGWMETVLSVASRAQARPRRYAKPSARDEAILQQQGLALGSEQWGLALQVAAFANAEGVSYAKMQEVIGGMDVCELGIAVESVSARLPTDVRARIWADLMPEIMVGNTPYVMYRVTDYFFLG